MGIETYFDKKTNEMKNHWYKKCNTLIKQCDKLRKESDKLYEASDEHLSNGNECEWEDCLRRAIEKESFADGIECTLKELGFM